MAKNVERLQAREAKELIRREKQLGARSNKFYLIYLFYIHLLSLHKNLELFLNFLFYMYYQFSLIQMCFQPRML